MKNRVLSILLILALLFIPELVIAGDCSSSETSGDASSSAPSGGSGSKCDDTVCLNTDGKNYTGVRFQIYKYDGSGKVAGIKMIGKGVDVWSTKALRSTSYKFTNPSTPNLKNKASCDNATYSNDNKIYRGNTRILAEGTPSLNTEIIYPLTAEQYLTGNYGKVYYDSSLKNHFWAGTVNEFILTYSNGKTSNGWLHTNVFSKLASNNSADKKEVQSLFQITDAQMNDLMARPGEYYVTAEVLYRYKSGGSSYGLKKGRLYLGTVSESAFFEGAADMYNALRSSGGSVGKLASEDAKSGSYLIKQVDKDKGNFYNAASIYNSGGKSTNAKTACRSAWGYAVYHVATVCWDCKKIEPLYDQLNFDGCPANTKNKCATSPNGPTKIANDDCEELQSKGITQRRLASQTCYEDVGIIKEKTNEEDGKKEVEIEKYIVVQAPNNIQKKDDNVNYESNIKAEEAPNQPIYWKIDCTEDLYLKDLPTPKKVKVNDLGVGNLYLGYTTKYQKECKLYYRVKEKNATIKWKQTYKDSLLEEHIRLYGEYKEDVENALNNKKPNNEEKNKLNAVKTKIETAITQLGKVKEQAQKYFNDIDNKEYSDGVPVVSNGTIKLVQETETTKVLKLVPAFCQFNKESKYYCDLKTGEGKNFENDIVACDDPSSEQNVKVKPDLTDEQKKSMTAEAIKAYEEEAKKINEFNRRYIKTVYYALPSSFIATLYGGTSRVFYSKSDCESAIQGQATANACKEVENVWIFTDVEGPEIAILNEKLSTSSLKINLSGYGSCGQFEYGLTCKYQFEKTTACAKCIYDYTDATGKIIDQDAYDACFRRYCSCASYCGSDVACRFKYCPEECEGCGWEDKSKCDSCEQDCKNLFPGNTEKDIVYRAKCKYNDCCRVNCNGDEGCLHQCCVHECSEICSADENSEVCRNCWQTCPDLKGDYMYRSINMNRPFPNGTDVNGRAPGKNWSGRVQYITKANDNHTIYYDATSGFNDDYEYAFEFTSDQLQTLKNDYNNNSKMYSRFYGSKKAKNYSNKNVYCSSIIHEYLKSKNVKVSGNRITNKVGSGCEVK